MRRRESRGKLELDQLGQRDDFVAVSLDRNVFRIGETDSLRFPIARVFTSCDELDLDVRRRVAQNFACTLKSGNIAAPGELAVNRFQTLRRRENVDIRR